MAIKKNQKIESLDDSEQKWAVAEVINGTTPMILRINETARSWVKHPSLSIRVGFAIPLNNPNPEGMPEPEENIQLSEIEDKIELLVKSSVLSIHVLTITTGTFKEFVFYVENGDAVAKIHKELIEEINSHEIQCIAEHDSEWSVYKSMTKA